MSQYSDPHPPVPPSIAAPPGYSPMAAPPRPQVVHIVAKPGGFWRAATFIIGLVLFIGVFFVGLGFGITIMVAGASAEQMVIRETYRTGRGGEIAIIPVKGIINDRQADFVHAAVNDALNNRSVKAVVLRVDSPGGDVTASDQIWYDVNRLKNHGLPVVASYGGVAASGGYYVSCAADHIMAQETCLTGSIGVIAQVLTFEGLLDKVGVQPVTLVATSSPEKSVANDIFRAWNEQDKEKVRIMLDSAYATFNQRVRDGRKAVMADPEQVNAAANGSIYTAQQAKEKGLVDSIGYMDDAINEAERRAGLTVNSAKVIIIRQPPTLFGALAGAEARAGSTPGLTGLNADAIRSFVNDLASPRMMYLMH